MELKAFDSLTGSEGGQWFSPKGLDGKPIGMRIKLYGPDSRKYNELKDTVQRDMYKSIADAANGMEVKADVKTEAEKEARFYADLTIDWEALDESDPVMWEGQPFMCNPDNAYMLYTHISLIRNQVKMFVENRRNFYVPGFADSDARSGLD